MNSVSMLVAAALLLVLVVAQDEGAKSSPFIVVSKTVTPKLLVLGEKAEVTVTVTNYGQGAAYDVQITDKVTGGDAQTKTVDVLNFLENTTLSYTVTPAEYGGFAIPQAEATYALAAGEPATHRSVSNAVREEDLIFRGEEFDDMTGRGTITVLTKEEYDRMHTRFIREAIAYLFIGAITVVFPFFMYRTKQNQVDMLIRQSRKK